MSDAGLPQPLVTADWLAAHLGEEELVVVDGSWYLPALNRSAVGEYLAGHIPGAAFWDIDQLSDRSSPLPHMLLEPRELGRQIGILGIGNADRVVVYDGSGTNLSAARIWWTFRAAGHHRVAVLDGGMPAWRGGGRLVQAGWKPWAAKRFEVHPDRSLVRSLDDVRAALGGVEQIVDARSRGRFEGTEPEPRPGLRGGHIPGSRNLPFQELSGPDGTLLAEEPLRAAFTAAGLDLGRPVIASCGSGVTACALVLGLEALGHRQWAVYDGSWSEWGREGGPPVEAGAAQVR